jgi:uncharacterized protein (DUF1810 family)
MESNIMSEPAFNLARFKAAQDAGGSFAQALAELSAGRKVSHWVWWVFPQVAGLGASATSERYAISGRDEACAYLADATLRSRLLEAAEVVVQQLRRPDPPPLHALMGSRIDALKLVSSMTLFERVAGDARVKTLPDVAKLASTARAVLEAALASGYRLCAHTLREVGLPR